MSTAITSATLLFLALAALLLNLNLYSAWRWPVKAIATVATMVLIIATYLLSDRLFGWPTNEPLRAGEYIFIAASILEPNKRSGSDGAIYVWVRNVSDNPSAAEQGPPRAYRLAYSRTLHQATLSALQQLEQNKGQGMRVGGKDGRSLAFFDLSRTLPPKRGQ